MVDDASPQQKQLAVSGDSHGTDLFSTHGADLNQLLGFVGST